MDIKDRNILILGGWGLVGTAVLRKLGEHRPNSIIILSLKEKEALEACQQMEQEFPHIKCIPEWGNIFVREELKDLSRNELMENDVYRGKVLEDTMNAYNQNIAHISFLNKVISRHRPHIIIDTVNTATGLAYQDIYKGYFTLKKMMKDQKEIPAPQKFNTEIEKMLTTQYIPQIIRHIQILHDSMVKNKTGLYLKIGTTGTGGMGLNIPYTHSEEKPSRVLLSKTSLGGAHTMLLFLMGRTPDGPIIKEVKPAAAIAWKSIGYGEIKKHGKPIRLFDCQLNQAVELNQNYSFNQQSAWDDLNENLKSVYIDTGENGIFSQGEFETITSQGQMEFVTPEEIAENAIMEILGDSTGHDILNALNNSVMGPTYRAGYMRHQALDEMDRLQIDNDLESIAFEILGPPRLSKILFEAYLLKKICGDLECIRGKNSKFLADEIEKIILENQKIRTEIISIGIPILLKDGKSLLRGPEVKIPNSGKGDSNPVNSDNINEWAEAGWVDLRQKNMEVWLERIEKILTFVGSLDIHDSSSRQHHGHHYWDSNKPLNIGRIAAWLFMNEDKGLRIKH